MENSNEIYSFIVSGVPIIEIINRYGEEDVLTILESIKDANTKTKPYLKSINELKLTGISRDAINAGKLKEGISALQEINKMNDLYNEGESRDGDSTIKLDFGFGDIEEENNEE